MKLFSILILFVCLPVSLALVRNYNRSAGKAWARIFFIAFLLMLAASLLFSSTASRVAKLVGVPKEGRGLLFYLSVVGLTLLAGATLSKFREVEQKQVALTRQVALLIVEQETESIEDAT